MVVNSIISIYNTEKSVFNLKSFYFCPRQFWTFPSTNQRNVIPPLVFWNCWKQWAIIETRCPLKNKSVQSNCFHNDCFVVQRTDIFHNKAQSRKDHASTWLLSLEQIATFWDFEMPRGVWFHLPTTRLQGTTSTACKIKYGPAMLKAFSAKSNCKNWSHFLT